MSQVDLGVGAADTDPTQNVRDLVVASDRRQDDLREQAVEALRREATIHADYAEKLRDAEAKRIDAIRSVDVGAVNRAAEVAATQAATLAAQVQTSAETLRGQVSAAATATATALATALEPILKRLEELSRVQYEQQGQRTQQVESKGSNQWATSAVIAIVGLLLALAVAGSAFISSNRASPTPPASVVCTVVNDVTTCK